MSTSDLVLGSLTLLVFGGFLGNAIRLWRQSYRYGELTGYAVTPRTTARCSPAFIKSVSTLAGTRRAA
jgi:hypothetical protein